MDWVNTTLRRLPTCNIKLCNPLFSRSQPGEKRQRILIKCGFVCVSSFLRPIIPFAMFIKNFFFIK